MEKKNQDSLLSNEPRQMEFKHIDDLNQRITVDLMLESQRKVAEMIRELSMRQANFDDFLLWSSLSNKQLQTLAKQLNQELEKRNMV